MANKHPAADIQFDKKKGTKSVGLSRGARVQRKATRKTDRTSKQAARQAKADTMRGNLGGTMKSMQQTMYPTKKGDKDSGLSFEQRNFNSLVDALTMRRSKKK
jgi:hypothetical protein